MRIGLLKLTDSAPVIVAQELGFFAEENVPAVISLEPSWGNIADKLAHGFLDAAVIVPPLAFAVALGLRGPACRLIVPQAINLGGNSITFSTRLTERLALDGGQSVLERSRRVAANREPLRLAVVHQYSTHALLLRYWLAAGGPERDVTFSVIPPSQMVEALASGAIDGFCAGAPWGDVAAEEGCGKTIATSFDIWRNGPEKVLAVRETWAQQNGETLQRAQRAVLRAAEYCDEPANARAVAAILALPEYLNINAAVIAQALHGPALRFFRHTATMPWLSHAEWFLAQMQRWGQLPPDLDIASAAAQMYRPALYRAAAQSLGLPVPDAERKAEGHDAVWMLQASPDAIAMEPDGFFDQKP